MMRAEPIVGYKRSVPHTTDTSDDDDSQPERDQEAEVAGPKLDQAEGQRNKKLRRVIIRPPVLLLGAYVTVEAVAGFAAVPVLLLFLALARRLAAELLLHTTILGQERADGGDPL